MVDEEHKELDALREEVDEVDHKFLDELSEFVRERLKIVKKIGAYKRGVGRDITDKGREEIVIRDRINTGKSKNLSGEMVKRIWEAIIDDAKARE